MNFARVQEMNYILSYPRILRWLDMSQVTKNVKSYLIAFLCRMSVCGSARCFQRR